MRAVAPEVRQFLLERLATALAAVMVGERADHPAHAVLGLEQQMAVFLEAGLRLRGRFTIDMTEGPPQMFRGVVEVHHFAWGQFLGEELPQLSRAPSATLTSRSCGWLASACSTSATSWR
ncbi:MAG: hypothetical protein IPI02_02420 [Sterolibacteriaceae bacterium]|nr:hypothetical protein [Sterolibacteriaceae bacterium]